MFKKKTRKKKDRANYDNLIKAKEFPRKPNEENHPADKKMTNNECLFEVYIESSQIVLLLEIFNFKTSSQLYMVFWGVLIVYLFRDHYWYSIFDFFRPTRPPL